MAVTLLTDTDDLLTLTEKSRKLKKHSKKDKNTISTNHIHDCNNSNYEIDNCLAYESNEKDLSLIKKSKKRKKHNKENKYTESLNLIYDCNNSDKIELDKNDNCSLVCERNDDDLSLIEKPKKRKKHNKENQYTESSYLIYDCNNSDKIELDKNDNCSLVCERNDDDLSLIEKPKKRKKHNKENKNTESSNLMYDCNCSNKNDNCKLLSCESNKNAISLTEKPIKRKNHSKKIKYAESSVSELDFPCNSETESHDCNNSQSMLLVEKQTNKSYAENLSVDYITGVDNLQKCINYFEPSTDPEILDFDIPPLHEKESVSVPSKEMLDEFKTKGIEIKTGKWSNEEVSILERNFNNFIEMYGVEDPFVLFGIGRIFRSKESLNFIRNTRFYVQLGKDLCNRTLRSIYVKARELFNPLKSKITASKREVSFVLKKQRLIGNKWTKIGMDLERTGSNTHEIYRWNEKSINKGKWSEEENKLLINAIQQILGTSNLSDMSRIQNISWNKVAELVPSRNYSQCYHQWAEHLAWSNPENKKKWNKMCHAKLIYLLKKNHYKDDEVNIDWKTLQKSFKDASPSDAFLRKKWKYLKSKIIKKKRKTLKNKLDFLNLLYKDKIERYKKFK